MKYHRICIQRIGDWKNQFLDKFCTSQGNLIVIRPEYKNNYFFFEFSHTFWNKELDTFYSSDFLLAKASLYNVIHIADVYHSSQSMVYHLPVHDYPDYLAFFDLFVENGRIKEEYRNATFAFEIELYSDGQTKVDEQRLFYFFLIANKFRDTAKFFATVNIGRSFEEFDQSPDFYRLNTFIFMQLIGRPTTYIRIRQGWDKYTLNNGYVTYELKKWPYEVPGSIKNLVPVLTIDSKLLSVLQNSVTRKQLDSIYGKQAMDLTSQEGVLLYLCRQFLFSEIESEADLSKLRGKTFELPQFKEMVEGVSLLALVIFSMFDYKYRTNLAKQYKDKLRSKTSAMSIRLRAQDFLDGFVYAQGEDEYWASNQLTGEGVMVKNLLDVSYTNKVPKLDGREKNNTSEAIFQLLEEFQSGKGTVTFRLHSALISELYEAVSIAEGVLQLVENVVFHTGEGNQPGVGLLSLHIHESYGKSSSRMDDTDDLFLHYGTYMEKQTLSGIMYFMEMKIADLSAVDIPQKFKENHRDFIASDPNKEIYRQFGLQSFFSPSSVENTAWRAFYFASDHIVNHYGLQLFNSIVLSKGGLFYVTSQDASFCSMNPDALLPTMPKVRGTTYTILLPLNSQSSQDKNIYDSMFGYELETVIRAPLPVIEPFLPPKSNGKLNHKEKANSITTVASALDQLFQKNREKSMIISVDIGEVSDIECLVKGIISCIYHQCKNVTPVPLRFALLNCTAYQIVNIVRIISLFYNRQGDSDAMENVQIYLRGREVGEEILFFGKCLSDVQANIARIASIRGIMHENYKVLHDILMRGQKEEHDESQTVSV